MKKLTDVVLIPVVDDRRRPASTFMAGSSILALVLVMGCDTVGGRIPQDALDAPMTDFSGEWVLLGGKFVVELHQNGDQVTGTGRSTESNETEKLWGTVKGRAVQGSHLTSGAQAARDWAFILSQDGVTATWVARVGQPVREATYSRSSIGDSSRHTNYSDTFAKDVTCVLCEGRGVWTEVRCPGCDGMGIWGQRKGAGPSARNEGNGNTETAPASERKDAGAYYMQGVQEYLRGAYDDAIKSFSMAIERSALYPQAWIDRGIARQAKGDLDGAFADMAKAIELDPSYAKHTDLLQHRGLIWHAKGNFDAALLDFSKCIELEPTSDVYFYRGKTRFSKKDFDGAIADYSKSLELGPGNAYVFYWRGLAKMRKGDLEEVIRDCSEAIEGNSQDSAAYELRGYARGMRGKVTEGLADLSKAIEINPKRSQAYRVRGYIRYNSQQWTDALADFRKSSELDRGGGTDRNHQYIWLILTRLGEKESATKALEQYLQTKKQGKADEWSLAIGRFLAGELSEEDLAKSANTADEKNSRVRRCEAYFYSGSKRLLNGDKAGAIDILKKCVETDAKSIAEYYSASCELRNLDAGK